ncbi:uncharacterized protein [Rutidosis leptorrhynchoides]|uniref:uncharacterized protein n=1 Tax=Rutidosis leptorrhynchoides TaxID=125765 RepID=UPI003A9A357E
MDDRIEEGGSTIRPPLLTESNYDYWKSRMKWYLKGQDELIWRATQIKWTPPTITVNEVEDIKSEDQWTAAERALCTANSKAVGIIQCVVRPSVFKIIQNLETTKESWDALQLTYEGTKSVRNSKLHLLSTRFESLTMKYDETVADFEKNLRYIANESAALDEVIPKSKLVRKVLISLPEKFSSKMDAISESTEFENLRLDDLMGKLGTHELTLAMRNRDKTKSKFVAFKTDVEASPVSTGDQELREQVELLTKNMGKLYRRINRTKINDYPSPNQKSNRSFQKKTESGGGNQRFTKGETSRGKSNRIEKERIQCHECQGFGHIAAKCANTLEREKRSLFSTWSDDETFEDNFETSVDSEDDNPSCKALTAHTVSTPQNSVHTESANESESSKSEIEFSAYSGFTARASMSIGSKIMRTGAVCIEKKESSSSSVDKSKSSNDEESSRTVTSAEDSRSDESSDSNEDRDIHSDFKELLEQMGKSLRINHLLSDEVQQLKDERKDFDKILGKYESEIEQLKFELSESKKKLEEANCEIKKLNRVTPKNNVFGVDHSSSKIGKENRSRHKNRGRRIICHYYNIPGHIRPKCYILQDDIRNLIASKPRRHPKKKVDITHHSQRRIWVEKKNVKNLMCRISSRETDEWYFDSGCSKHMTGEKRMLKDIVYKQQGEVVCGNGKSNAIIREGRLPVSSDSKIKHVLLVEGLKNNLISIAQVCDEDCEVNFTKHGCKVVNGEGEIVMTGSRKIDNMYTLDGDINCPKTSTKNQKIWHKKSGPAEMAVKKDGEPVLNQPQSIKNTPGVEALETEGVGRNENAPSVEASPVSTDTRNVQETMPAITSQNLSLFTRGYRKGGSAQALFLKSTGREFIIALSYAARQMARKNFQYSLASKSGIRMDGEVSYYLGIQIMLYKDGTLVTSGGYLSFGSNSVSCTQLL